jgi:hypothetical protein
MLSFTSTRTFKICTKENPMTVKFEPTDAHSPGMTPKTTEIQIYKTINFLTEPSQIVHEPCEILHQYTSAPAQTLIL